MIAHAQPDGPTYRVHPETAQEHPAAAESRTPPPPDPLGPLREQLHILSEQAAYYWALQKDAATLKVRTALLWGAAGLLGAIVGTTVLATAAVLLLAGMAAGLGELFGGRLWAGQLVTSLVVLAVIASGTYYIIRKATHSSRYRTLQKYEQLQRRQRAADEHRARERAARQGTVGS